MATESGGHTVTVERPSRMGMFSPMWVFDSDGATRTFENGTCFRLAWDDVVSVDYDQSGGAVTVRYRTDAGPAKWAVAPFIIKRSAIGVLVDQIAAHVPHERVDPAVWSYSSDESLRALAPKMHWGQMAAVVAGVCLGIAWYAGWLR